MLICILSVKFIVENLKADFNVEKAILCIRTKFAALSQKILKFYVNVKTERYQLQCSPKATNLKKAVMIERGF